MYTWTFIHINTHKHTHTRTFTVSHSLSRRCHCHTPLDRLPLLHLTLKPDEHSFSHPSTSAKNPKTFRTSTPARPHPRHQLAQSLPPFLIRSTPYSSRTQRPPLPSPSSSPSSWTDFVKRSWKTSTIALCVLLDFE